MEVKKLIEKLKNLQVTQCENCPFNFRRKNNTTDCKLKGSICLQDLHYLKEECTGLLQLEEYFEKHKNSTSSMDNQKGSKAK